MKITNQDTGYKNQKTKSKIQHQPYTLYPIPYTLHLTPYTFHLIPYSLHLTTYHLPPSSHRPRAQPILCKTVLLYFAAEGLQCFYYIVTAIAGTIKDHKASATCARDFAS